MKTTDLINLYLNSLKTGNRAEGTLESYNRTLQSLNRYLKESHQTELNSQNIAKVSPVSLLNWLNSINGFKNTTKNLRITHVKCFFKFCADLGMISETANPAKVLKEIKIHKDEVEEEEKYFNSIYKAEEVQKILQMAKNDSRYGKRNQIMIAILFSTGLRISELCSLNFGDVRHLKNGTFSCVRKGGNRYRIPLSTFAMEYLVPYLLENKDKADDEPLFVNNRGERITNNSFYPVISRIQKQLGKPTGAHKIRHAFLTELQNSCSNMALVRDVASHSNTTVTDRYTHTAMEHRVNAVNNLSWNATH